MPETNPPANLDRFRPLGPVIPSADLPPWFEGKAFAQEAARLLEQAKQQASEAVSAGKTRGYDEGWQSAAGEVAALLTRTQLEINALHARLEDEVIKISIGVVKQILDEYEPGEAIVRVVKRALHGFQPGGPLTLAVPPDLEAEVKGRVAEAFGSPDSPVQIVVRANAELKGRSATLLSEVGSVDLSIDRQLEILAQTLRSLSQAR